MSDLATNPANLLGGKRDLLPNMGLLAHLEELRRRIIYCAVATAAGFLVCWFYAERIFGLMQRPILEALRHNGLDNRLVYLNPTEPFNIYMKIGLIAGLFLVSPFVLYQLWLFISPALYRREKRYVLPFMVSTVTLFLMGGYFGYHVAYPAALDFLVSYGKQFAPMITIGEYTNLFLTIIVGLGVLFEMPILVFFLAFMGVVSAAFMWRHLRYAILAIFVIAAIVTPTTDIINMLMFAAPMVGLYLISIAVAWMVHPKRRHAA